MNRNSLNNIYKNCLKEMTNENFRYYDDKNGYDLWKDMINSNISIICKVLKKLGLTKVKDKVYFNSIYGKYHNIYQDSHNFFPDSSYYRLTPKYYNRKDIIFGTYDFQHYLYNIQHPTVCDDKKFLLIQGWNAGHISEIHIISSYLKVSLESNRIAIFDPRYKSNVANGDYCNNYPRNWECYLEPLSNCTLSKEDISKSVKYKNYKQNDKVVLLGITSIFGSSFPSILYSFFKQYNYSKRFYHIYWTIQSVTYTFRLNKRTYNYLMKNIPLIKDLRGKEYMNVWVRHGNKVHEMKLISTDLYDSSIKFYYKVWGKIGLYISSDDPEAINYFSKIYIIKYLNYKRKNDPDPNNALVKGDSLTLNVIADLLIAISSMGYSGTLRSNIARIINELRMTVGYRLNSPYFEIGYLNNSVLFSDSTFI